MSGGAGRSGHGSTADPCDDFYQYACGGLAEGTEIPAIGRGGGRGFNVIEERNEQMLKEILRRPPRARLPPGTPYAKKLGDYYATCMDEAKLDGAVPELRADELAAFDRRQTIEGAGHGGGGAPRRGARRALPLRLGTRTSRTRREVIGKSTRAALGLPDRDYYLKDDPKMKEIREAVPRSTWRRMFELTRRRARRGEARRRQVMDLETAARQGELDRVVAARPEEASTTASTRRR